jgi:hypothetical protein
LIRGRYVASLRGKRLSDHALKPNVLAMSCKARLVMLASKLPEGPCFASSMARLGHSCRVYKR